MPSLLNQIELEVITLCSYLSSINSCLNYGTRHRDLKPRDLEPRDLRHVSSDFLIHGSDLPTTFGMPCSK